MKVLITGGESNVSFAEIERRRKIGLATSTRRKGQPREAGAAAKQTETMRGNGSLSRIIDGLAAGNRGRKATAAHRALISEANRRRVIGPATREKHRQKARRQWVEGRVSRLTGTARRSFRADLNCTFRSSWEANVARVFNAIGVAWEYEPHRFALPSGRSYCPDFLLGNGVYVEVKGYLRPEAQSRMVEFRQAYGQLRLRLIDQTVYGMLARRWSHLEGWEG